MLMRSRRRQSHSHSAIWKRFSNQTKITAAARSTNSRGIRGAFGCFSRWIRRYASQDSTSRAAWCVSKIFSTAGSCGPATMANHHAPPCTTMHQHTLWHGPVASHDGQPPCNTMHHHAPPCTTWPATMANHHATPCTTMHHHAPTHALGGQSHDPMANQSSQPRCHPASSPCMPSRIPCARSRGTSGTACKSDGFSGCPCPVGLFLEQVARSLAHGGSMPTVQEVLQPPLVPLLLVPPPLVPQLLRQPAAMPTVATELQPRWPQLQLQPRWPQPAVPQPAAIPTLAPGPTGHLHQGHQLLQPPHVAGNAECGVKNAEPMRSAE